MADIRYNTIIDASPEKVWQTLTNVERYPDWFPRVREVRNPRGQPGETGSTYEVVYELPAGGEVEGTSEIVRSERARLLEERFEMSGGVSGFGRTTIQAQNGATRLEMEGELDVPGGLLGDLAAPMLSAGIEREVENVMDRLKEVCERD